MAIEEKANSSSLLNHMNGKKVMGYTKAVSFREQNG